MMETCLQKADTKTKNFARFEDASLDGKSQKAENSEFQELNSDEQKKSTKNLNHQTMLDMDEDEHAKIANNRNSVEI